MNDYENAILARQESETDECATCEFLEDCRSGKTPLPCTEESLLYPVYFKD